MRALRIVGTSALWVISVLAAAAFVAIGLAKFAAPEWQSNFARWGYPDGFYMLIGALELAAGLLLLVPRLASYAAALLAVIMLAAAATHAVFGETARIAGPLMWLAIVALIGWARRRRAWHGSVRPLAIAAKQV